METKTVDYWVNHLSLAPHPEGGFYKEVYRSSELINKANLPGRFSGPRNFSTAIYFLLRSEDKSVFHRIKSDELWHFYAGSSLEIFVLDNHRLHVLKLGTNIESGESPQVVVPAGCWFGARVAQPATYTLAGCTVAPGFSFDDFEIAHREDLLREFPGEKGIIFALT